MSSSPSPDPSPLSLLSVVDSLQQRLPSFTLSDLTRLVVALQSNSALFKIPTQQLIKGDSVGFSKSISVVANLIFRPGEEAAFEIAADVEKEKLAVVLIAQALKLLPRSNSPHDPSSVPAPLTSTLKTLSTSRRTCLQCAAVLLLVRERVTQVILLDASSITKATCVRLRCMNDSCRTVHMPDYAEISDGERELCIYYEVEDVKYIKVDGHGRVYATQAWIDSYMALLDTNHVATSSFTDSFMRLYGGGLAGNWKLTSDQVWRVFVIYNALLLSAEQMAPLIIEKGCLTEDIVKNVLGTWLVEKLIPGAEEHSCPECSRYGRVWSTMKEGRGGRSRKVVDREDKNLVEDTIIDEERVVRMAVMDGIRIGHAVCAYPECDKEPTDYRCLRFCCAHSEYHTLCGVFGCGRERSDEEGCEACDLEEHQALWRKRVEKKGRKHYMGWKRLMRDGKVEGKGRNKKRKWDEVEKPDEVDELDSEEEQENFTKPTAGTSAAKVQTMWSYGRTSGIQLLLWSCGCIFAWEKFYERESDDEVLRFLNRIPRLPDYLAYDQACRLLLAISKLEPSEVPEWRDQLTLLVDAFHYEGHSKMDMICRKLCNPAPVDGSHPDLVVPLVAKYGGDKQRQLRRVFNTEAAEQLNSWLSGFGPILRQLKADNHDFLVHILLRRKFEQRSNEMKKRYLDKKVG